MRRIKLMPLRIATFLAFAISATSANASEAFLDITKVPKLATHATTRAWMDAQTRAKEYFHPILALIDAGDASEGLLETWSKFTSKSTVLGPITRELFSFPPGNRYAPGTGGPQALIILSQAFEAWSVSIHETICDRRVVAEAEAMEKSEIAEMAATECHALREANVRLHALLAAKERERDDARAAATAVAGGGDELFGTMEAW